MRSFSLRTLVRILAWVSALWLGTSARAGAQPPVHSPPQQIVVPHQLEPAYFKWPPAETPPDAIEAVLQIDAAGTVTTVVLAPATRAQLSAAGQAAAMSALSRLRFAPAQRDGRAIASRVRMRFRTAAVGNNGGEGSPADSDARAPAPTLPPTTSPDENGRARTASTSPGAQAQAKASEPAAAPASSPTNAGPPHAALPAAAADSNGEPEAEASYGARARIERRQPGAASRIKLRGPELRMIPGTFGEPLRVVATLPGVAHTPFGLGFFVVRGASFQNTGFFVDGFAVPLLYHLGAGPAIIASRLVDKLDFYPGGYPTSFGQFTAGIIALHTAPPPTDRLQLELEVDLLRASGLLVVPLPNHKGSVALALRRSYYELVLPLITHDVSLSYTDYQLRLDYQLAPNLSFALFFFGSRDRLNAGESLGAGSTTGSASQGLHYDFDQVIASMHWRPRPRLRVAWSGTAGPSTIDLTGQSTGDDSLGTQTHAFRLGERLEVVATPAAQWQTTLGAEISVFQYNVQGSVPSLGELPPIPAPASTGHALSVSDRLAQLTFAPYVEQVFRPGPFELTAGLRANYFRYGDVSTWVADPRGVVRYALSKRVKLKLASGLFAQPPLPFQLVRSFGNPKLAPARAWQSSAGAELKLMAALEVDATLFYNRMWQLARTSSDLAVNASGKPTRPFFRADGEGRAYGLEFMLRRRLRRGLFGWLSYTLSRSERFLPGGRTIVFGYDQTHVLNLAASYAWSGWTFGARFTLATGRPVNDLYDPNGKHTAYDSDRDAFDPNSGGRRTRLPTYNELDVRIDRDFELGPLKGSVYLDVINVYNAQNSESYRYQFDFARRGRLPGLPLLPTIGIRGVLR